MSTHPHARTGAPLNSWQWRCDVCGRPIHDGHGYVELVDPATGGYPKWSLADQKRFDAAYEAARAKFGASLTGSEWDTLPEQPPRCLIVAYHKRCDPRPDREAYWFDVERARGNEVLDWVAHLLGKGWFGREEAIAFIRRYQDGRCAADDQHVPQDGAA